MCAEWKYTFHDVNWPGDIGLHLNVLNFHFNRVCLNKLKILQSLWQTHILLIPSQKVIRIDTPPRSTTITSKTTIASSLPVGWGKMGPADPPPKAQTAQIHLKAWTPRREIVGDPNRPGSDLVLCEFNSPCLWLKLAEGIF